MPVRSSNNRFCEEFQADGPRRVKEKIAALHLRMHPDKFLLIPARCGVDFMGFVVMGGFACEPRRLAVFNSVFMACGGMCASGSEPPRA